MSDDFCILHGYQFMKSRFADPIPYCQECDRLRALGIDPVMHWLDHEGDYPTIAPPPGGEGR